MRKKQKIVFISFYDLTCIGARLLSTIVKNNGHTSYMLIFKDDRAVTLPGFKKDALYYQSVFNLNYVGTGEDVNPPTETEIGLFLDKIRQIKPDVIALSGRSVTKEMSKNLVERLRKIFPKARYIGGGFGPLIEPECFLDFLDYVCLGEGEKAILDLVELEDPSSCDNIATLENGKLRYNKLAKGVNVDAQPYPDWFFENKFMVEDDKIVPLHQCYDTKAYFLFAARGCPASCTYCQASQLPYLYKGYGGSIEKVRLRSPQNVIDELLWAKKEFDIQSVKFMDSIFGIKKSWFYEFMELYNKHINLKFHCLTDSRWNDEKMIERMLKSGLTRCVVGIQATTEKLRKDVMGRDVKDERIINFAKTLVESKIPVRYDIIHWNPFDTNETLAQGVKFLRKLPKGEHVEIFKLKVFPGSKMLERILKENPRSLSDAEYEYWLWIYQLILRSREGERIADFAMKYEYFKKYPGILKSLLEEIIKNTKYVYRLFAARDIEPGTKITPPMLIRMKSNLVTAIEFDSIKSIEGRSARKKIGADQPITASDIYGSYERKFG